MKPLIVTKEAAVKGCYEEPIYDNAPSYTYTKDIIHRLRPGDNCYIDDAGRIWYESDEYGVSFHGADLWLCPTETERKSIFGVLTKETKESWYRLMGEKSEMEERLDSLSSELYAIQMDLEYQLDAENEDASIESAWTVLANQSKLEYEFARLEYRYFGIRMSIQLLVHTLTL